MVGILVHGNNHFILSGPLPDEATALALARHWPIIRIGEAKSSFLGQPAVRATRPMNTFPFMGQIYTL